jgi:hypothetical protein
MLALVQQVRRPARTRAGVPRPVRDSQVAPASQAQCHCRLRVQRGVLHRRLP